MSKTHPKLIAGLKDLAESMDGHAASVRELDLVRAASVYHTFKDDAKILRDLIAAIEAEDRS